MEVKSQNKRPKHLNLLKIKLPLPAVVSIIHRVSGVLLFFPGIPLILIGFQMFLESEQSYQQLLQIFSSPFVKITFLLGLWFFMHHLCAGIRYLALDLHLAITLKQTRTTSKMVLVVGILLTLLIGVAIW